MLNSPAMLEIEGLTVTSVRHNPVRPAGFEPTTSGSGGQRPSKLRGFREAYGGALWGLARHDRFRGLGK